MKNDCLRCFGWLTDEHSCAARQNCKRFVVSHLDDREHADRPVLDERGVCLSYLPIAGDAA